MKSKKLPPPKLPRIHLQTKPGMELAGSLQVTTVEIYEGEAGGEKAAGLAGATRLIIRKLEKLQQLKKKKK